MKFENPHLVKNKNGKSNSGERKAIVFAWLIVIITFLVIAFVKIVEVS